MKKGSITVFSSLIMMLVLSVVFVLLEGARTQAMRQILEYQTEAALEGVFGNYSSVLWKEYHLLATDRNDMEELLIRQGNARQSKKEDGLNLLQAEVDEVHTIGMTLLTDGNGTAYLNSITAAMEQTIGFGIAKELFGQYEAAKVLMEESAWSDRWMEEGLSQELSKDEPNPMEEMKQLQSAGILELLMEDTSALSRNTVNRSMLVSKRNLQQGISPQIYETGWLDKILLQQYLLSYMSSYANPDTERALVYELEYILGQKSSDIENLKTVVSEILMIREVCNFLYLCSDPTRSEEASVMALALAGVSANPFVIETVKMGILAAWALGESVLDVRALLQGKRIALLKSAESWTLQLSNIGLVKEGMNCAKESKDGLSYQDYIGILMLFQEEQDVAMYTMDVQEATMRKQSDNDGIHLDDYLIQSEVEMIYNYHTVFYSGAEAWISKIHTTANYSYN